MSKKPDDAKKKPEKKPKNESAELTEEELRKVSGGMAGLNRGIAPDTK